MKFVESKRCSTYELQPFLAKQCRETEIFCPNKGKCLSKINDCEAGIYFGNKTQCDNQNMFHCANSNQCIWQDWVCDGFIQCLEGDDEDFDLCYERGSFAEGATVKCAETKRFGYEVNILASKCDGVVECRDGWDELDCQSDDTKAMIAIGAFCALITLIWILIYYFYNEGKAEYHPSIEECDNVQRLRGESLAQIKV